MRDFPTKSPAPGPWALAEPSVTSRLGPALRGPGSSCARASAASLRAGPSAGRGPLLQPVPPRPAVAQAPTPLTDVSRFLLPRAPGRVRGALGPQLTSVP